MFYVNVLNATFATRALTEIGIMINGEILSEREGGGGPAASTKSKHYGKRLSLLKLIICIKL